ncbi:MAG TPA: DUF4410 domain-containing protein [Nitrospirota bacterium]|nr:DUF4410 domain-containing protein [Nitrospirota bacterium]
MKRYGMVIAVIAVLALVLSAGAGIVGAKGEDISVVIDRGIESSFTDVQVKNRNQVGDLMDEDLVKLLKKAGYEAHLIKDASAFQGKGYLLVVRIKSYNPGSKAARMFVGYGAGSTSMNIRYDLKDGSGTVVQGDDLGVGSSRDWRNVVRKLGEQTVDGVKKKLN